MGELYWQRSLKSKLKNLGLPEENFTQWYHCHCRVNFDFEYTVSTNLKSYETTLKGVKQQLRERCF